MFRQKNKSHIEYYAILCYYRDETDGNHYKYESTADSIEKAIEMYNVVIESGRKSKIEHIGYIEETGEEVFKKDFSDELREKYKLNNNVYDEDLYKYYVKEMQYNSLCKMREFGLNYTYTHPDGAVFSSNYPKARDNIKAGQHWRKERDMIKFHINIEIGGKNDVFNELIPSKNIDKEISCLHESSRQGRKSSTKRSRHIEKREIDGVNSFQSRSDDEDQFINNLRTIIFASRITPRIAHRLQSRQIWKGKMRGLACGM